jgi:hypothetical protein
MLAQLSASTAVPKTLKAANLLVLIPKNALCERSRAVNCWRPY